MDYNHIIHRTGYIEEYATYDKKYGLESITYPDTYRTTDNKRKPKYFTDGCPRDIEGLKVTGYSVHEKRHFQNKKHYNNSVGNLPGISRIV